MVSGLDETSAPLFFKSDLQENKVTAAHKGRKYRIVCSMTAEVEVGEIS
jgi:hypothetical protein